MLVLALKILGLMVLAGGAGYVIGSFPTAYLLVRWKSHVDIRQAGSGNVGSLNSFVVTRSKLVGILVLVIDFLKGALAVFVVGQAGQAFIYMAAAGVGAVLGHNFSVWLGFKGGRGLATAAGVMVWLGWMTVVVWGVVWVVAYFITRKVNLGNVIACVVTLLLTLMAPSSLLVHVKPDDASVQYFKFFAVIMFGIILIKHIEPMSGYLFKGSTSEGEEG